MRFGLFFCTKYDGGIEIAILHFAREACHNDALLGIRLNWGCLPFAYNHKLKEITLLLFWKTFRILYKTEPYIDSATIYYGDPLDVDKVGME